MAEARQYAFSYKELATLLVKKQDIHDGHWGIYVRFSLQGANVGMTPEGSELLPAAIVPIIELGIQKFDTPNSLSVDAAEANPAQPEARKKVR